MTCRCDRLIHPAPLKIDAGLSRLPRQIATFAEFRRAMMASVAGHAELAGWRARSSDDLGVMLLEMWAYACDAISLYDEIIANESYVRTCQRRTSVRRLVDLLGYVPRPAVAASVYLALRAEGRRQVVLPRGTAFRSGAFDGEAPQVFELESRSSVHPAFNVWSIKTPAHECWMEPGASATKCLFLEGGSSRLKIGDLTLVSVGGSGFVRTVQGIVATSDQAGNSLVQVEFDGEIEFSTSTAPGDITVLVATKRASLWQPIVNTAAGTQSPGLQNGTIAEGATEQLPEAYPGGLANNPYSTVEAWISEQLPRLAENEVRFDLTAENRDYDENPERAQTAMVELPSQQMASEKRAVDSVGENTFTIELDSVYSEVTPDDFVILSAGSDPIAFRVSHDPTVEDIVVYVPTEAPPVRARVTRLVLQQAFGLPSSLAANFPAAYTTVHFGLQPAGTVAAVHKKTIDSDDVLCISTPTIEPTDIPVPRKFLLHDNRHSAALVEGLLILDGADPRIDISKDPLPTLVAPLEAFGNVVLATRGETVEGEVLGNGDASQSHQSFELKKKPLTYLRDPSAGSEAGIVSTLQVHVDGIRWREVPTFFGVGKDDRVFTVRTADDGAATVTFGDGINGVRLPTGTDNIVASYRRGAGRASPPAGSVTQMATPLKGISSLNNPLSAFGGDDAEPADQMRTHAPSSALALGRAISLRDFEALTATQPGVLDVQVRWHWQGERQCPVVEVWYVGDSGIEDTVQATLESLSDPTMAIDVRCAKAVALHLSLDLDIDGGFVDSDVIDDVRASLTDPGSGLLAPCKIGIGKPLFRSRIFDTVLAVPGVTAVNAILQYGSPFHEIALLPKIGHYFDVCQNGTLVLSGEGGCHG